MSLNIKQPVDQELEVRKHNEEPEVDGPEVEGHMRHSPASPDARYGPQQRKDVER